MPDFGTTLKNLLDDRGISQKWLADAAGTNEATISRYVTGTNKSSRLDILASIAKALNVSTDYLLGITDVPQRKSELTAEEFILISAFRRASERDANIIWSILGTYLTPSEHELIDAQQENK
jgi:transcriptional regulator with XRE-family HTH domain